MCDTKRYHKEENSSSRHASHGHILKPQSRNKKTFKRMRSRIKRCHNASTAKIRGWKVRVHSFNYGGLGKLLKRAASVEVGGDEGDLVLNVPEV
jgi:hypothetical protein